MELLRPAPLHVPSQTGLADAVEDEKERSPAFRARETALAHLYAYYSPAIYEHCRRFLHSTASARDATQETFVRVIARGTVLAFETGALHYLYRVSTNVCLNILSKQKMQARAVAALATNAPGIRWNEFADREFVLAVLALSGEDGAQVAIMHYLEGMSQVEIAAALGIARRTVFNRLRKMARIARELLARDLRRRADSVRRGCQMVRRAEAEPG